MVNPKSILTFILLNFLFSGNAFACSCLPVESIEKAAETSSAIFVGNVTEIGTDPIRSGIKKIKLDIIRNIKSPDGLRLKKLNVYTGQDEASCGFNFQVNGDYLVYTTGTLAKLMVSSCGRTKHFDPARAEVKKVDELLNYTVIVEEVDADSKGQDEAMPIKKETKARPLGPSQLGF